MTIDVIKWGDGGQADRHFQVDWSIIQMLQIVCSCWREKSCQTF